MHAAVGDQLKVKSHHVGVVERSGVVVEVRGDQGGPPYLVRWEHGEESLFFPGADTVVEHSRASG
jgi:Domain of unknown function (DUF1918)